MGFTHITTCGSVGGGGGGGGGSNVTSLNYDISTETLTLGTDAPSVFSTIWPIKLENTIHVSKNGNDADALASTVQPFSLQVPFLTIEAAYAASTPEHTIVVWPGSYSLTTQLDINGNNSQRIHCLSGVKINNPSQYILNVTEGEEFWWTGYADFELYQPFYFNSGGSYFRLHVEAQKATNVSPETNALFMSIFETDFDIRITELINLGIDGSGWNRGFLGVDRWETQNQFLISFNLISSLYDTLGQSHIVVGGRTTEKAKIYRIAPAGTIPGFDFSASGQQTYKRKVEINADVDWMDGSFIVHSASICLWRGDALHRKSNTLGIDFSLYYAAGFNPGGEAVKPYFEHWGNIVTEGEYLNNSIADIRVSGNFIFHSTMQCSGQDDGISATLPCVAITNTDLDGSINVVFDGIFKTGPRANVGPIRVNETGNGGNIIKVQFLNCIAIAQSEETPVAPIYSELAAVVPIYLYPYHSLAMNAAFDPAIFSIGLSVDRSYYDTSVTYNIREYKGV